MNSMIQFKNPTPRSFTIFALFCFVSLPAAQALSPAPDGGYPGGNTAEGQNALFSLTSGGYNTAVGYFSLRSNNASSFNTAIGAGALLTYNAAIGEGNSNTATGAGSLLSNTVGGENTANGAFGLLNNTTGIRNTAIGYEALFNNTTGNGNTALGQLAGINQTSGNSNVYIGNLPGVAGESNACYVASIFGQAVDPMSASPVLIDMNSKLGTVTSSRRFKHDIKSMDKASEAILALKPVTFHYESDHKNTACFGLIAEEVAEVNPNLVIYDADGRPYTVRYDAVNAMLLNEFLKEHRKVEELEANATRQQRQIETLTAGLQKVSTQLELNKRASQTVLNSQ